MKKIVFSIIIIFITQITFSQTTESKIYLSNQVTTLPQYKGGNKKLNKFIKQNFNQKIASHIKGEILVSFVVEIDGSLSEIGVLSDLGKGSGDEAIRVMELSPKWIPGKLNGNIVRVQYLLKIPF
jgi:hypothetical protein